MTAPPVAGITRHFVTAGARQHHYRRSGAGAPIVLLHRIPRSSADLVPLMQALAGAGTVIAPDLAGYGGSGALDDAADIDAYARDLLALLDRIGVGRFVLHGDQVGARVAIRMAALAPDRVLALAATDRAVRGGRDAVPPPLVPAWDGTHLAQAWAYLREETCFAPWNDRRLAARIIAPMPAPDELQRRLVQLLSAGRHGRGYETALAAAADHDVDADLAALRLPLWDGTEALVDFLRRHTEGAAPPPPAPTAGIPGRLASRMVAVPGGQLHVRFNDDAGTIPLLTQHDAASSTGTVEPIVAQLIGRRSVIAIDLPGSGESDNLIGEDRPADLADYAEHVLAVIDALGLPQVDFYGMWGGGFVGCELALRHPDRVRRLVMSNLFFHEGAELRAIRDNYTPDVAPLWHGGHLLQCWHQMRDQGLFYPWFDRTEDGIIRREPFLATDMVHERVCSLLKAGAMYRTAYQAHFVYPIFERIAALAVPTLLATTEWDPNRPHSEAVAAAAPHCRFAMLDPDFDRWGAGMLPFLDEAG